jgi:hypothetical protein
MEYKERRAITILFDERRKKMYRLAQMEIIEFDSEIIFRDFTP